MTVGREQELAEITGAIEAAAAGDVRVLLVSGEAGIGKSRLIGELQRHAADRGAIVLVGATPVSGAADIPFAPMIDALRGLGRRVPEPERTAVLGTARPDIARLVPSLGDGVAPADAEDAHDPVPGGWARTRLFEGIAGVLERLGTWRPPAILVLEDIHWADQSSLDAFAFLGRILRDTPVLLAATMRTGDAGRPDQVASRLVEELSRQDHVTHLRLGRLSDGDIAALVEGLRGARQDAGSLEHVVRRADGIPLFAEELATAFADASAVPRSLQHVVGARLDGLQPGTLRVLKVGSLIGERMEYPLLRAAIGDMDDAALDGALRDAIGHHALVPDSGPWGFGFRFRHELLREAAAAEMLPAEQAAAHLAIADALTSVQGGAAALGGRSARLAVHLTAAGDQARALPAMIDAARAAEESAAFPEAARHYLAALVTWDRLRATTLTIPAEVSAMTHPQLMRRAAETAALTGSMDGAIRLAERACAEAERRGDPEQVALALERLGRFLWLADARDRSIETLAAAATAADAVPGTATQARVLAAQARALALAGVGETAHDAATRALTAARASGSVEREAAAWHALGLARSGLGDDAGALEAFAAAQRLRRPVDQQAVPAPSRILSLVEEYTDLAGALERAGRADESDEASRRGESMIERLNIASGAGARLIVERAERAFRAGTWDEAERDTRTVLAAELGSVRRAALVIRARLATGRGRYAEAAELVGETIAAATADGIPVSVEAWVAAAELALWRDRLDDARLALDAGRALSRIGDDPGLALELLSLAIRREADRAVLARLRRDTAEHADAVSAAVAIAAQARAVGAGASSRRTSATLALLALVDAERARAHGAVDGAAWAASADAFERVGWPWSAGYARWQAAECFATDRGGRDAARAAIAGATAIATRLGAAPLEERLRSLARRARLDVAMEGAATDSTPMPSGRPLGLSTRELEVLQLVADGRTNRQIAEALFITEKTAGHHVSSILGKLGVASRVEAAALAHRSGIARDTPARSRPNIE